MTTTTTTAQHLHQASHGHGIVSGFYQLAAGTPLDASATYRATRPDLGAHFGRTIGHCRCGVEVMQLCVEGDTGFSNRRGWVPVADLEAAYAENARRSAHTLTLVDNDHTAVFQHASRFEPHGLAVFTTHALSSGGPEPVWLAVSQVRDEYTADLIPVVLDQRPVSQAHNATRERWEV